MRGAMWAYICTNNVAAQYAAVAQCHRYSSAMSLHKTASSSTDLSTRGTPDTMCTPSYLLFSVDVCMYHIV